MGNQTFVKELFLSGLSDLPALQFPLFLFFLLIYLLTIIWNLLIIVLIVTDSHLHVPMTRNITIPACITQIFMIFFAASETFLLTVMSYDRYTAICQPLHYIQIMSWKVCVWLMSSMWCFSFIYSFIHTFFASKLAFCESDIIETFFCDFPQLLQISCSDISINILLMFILGGFFGGWCP
ncbi:TPA: hypothetical protein GDO54_018415, partial [Pyxicephalus adspersus]